MPKIEALVLIMVSNNYNNRYTKFLSVFRSLGTSLSVVTILIVLFSSACVSCTTRRVYKGILRNEVEKVKEIVSEGLNPNFSITSDIPQRVNSYQEMSPLLLAIYLRDLEMIEMLLESGADPNYKPEQCKSTPRTRGNQYLLCADSPIVQTIKQVIPNSGFHDRNYDVNLAILRMLLEAGADPNKLNGRDTPLFLLATQTYSKDSNFEIKIEMMKILLAHNANINLTIDYFGSGELHSVLAMKGYTDHGFSEDLATFLIERGAQAICIEDGAPCRDKPGFWDFVALAKKGADALADSARSGSSAQDSQECYTIIDDSPAAQGPTYPVAYRIRCNTPMRDGKEQTVVQCKGSGKWGTYGLLTQCSYPSLKEVTGFVCSCSWHADFHSP